MPKRPRPEAAEGAIGASATAASAGGITVEPGDAAASASSDGGGASVESDGEGPSLGDLQFAVLQFLKKRAAEAEGCTASEIQAATGAPLLHSVELRDALERNPKVLAEGGRYRWRTRYAARDAGELLRLINAEGDGEPLSFPLLAELYPGAADDLDALVRRGEVVRLHSRDAQVPDVFFARSLARATRIRLSGTVSVKTGSSMVATSSDLREEVFRNDLLLVGDPAPGGAPPAAFRVSSRSYPSRSRAAREAAATGGEGDDAPTGVHTVSKGNFVHMYGADSSVADTAHHRLHHSRVYAQPFTGAKLPLDRPWEGPSATGLAAWRVGATGDLRVLWREILRHDVLERDINTEKAEAAAAAREEGWRMEGEEDEEEVKEEEGGGGGEGAAVGASGGSGGGGGSPAPAAKTAAAAAAPARGEEDRIFLSLGGVGAFKSAAPFPPTHAALRAAMEAAGMATLMLEGTLEAEKNVPTRAEVLTAKERAAARRARGPRNLDSRLIQLSKTTAGLTTADQERTVAAQKKVLARKLAESHAEHAQKEQGKVTLQPVGQRFG